MRSNVAHKESLRTVEIDNRHLDVVTVKCEQCCGRGYYLKRPTLQHAESGFGGKCTARREDDGRLTPICGWCEETTEKDHVRLRLLDAHSPPAKRAALCTCSSCHEYHERMGAILKENFKLNS